MAEYDGNTGALLRRYVHGTSGGDDPLVWFEGSTVADSARRYLYADERGSIVAVTNHNGAKLTVNSYDEYGIPDNNGGTLSANGRFRYNEFREFRGHNTGSSGTEFRGHNTN